MNIKQLKVLIAVSLFCTGSLFAQVDKNGGSLYSIFGVGDLNYSTSTRTDAMGIMGIALYGKYLNSLNPAAWTRMGHSWFNKLSLIAGHHPASQGCRKFQGS